MWQARPSMAERTAGVERPGAWWVEMVKLALTVFCVLVGALAVAWALPERMRLQEKEWELRAAQREEALVRAERAVCETHYRALREDPEFIEEMARDRLDRCRAGERVWRIERK